MRKLGAFAGLGCIAALLSACAPPVDRTTLREVARFQNVARAEYQSIWSSYRFTIQSLPAEVAIVAPDTATNIAIARGEAQKRAMNGTMNTDSARGVATTDLGKGGGGASSGKGTFSTTAATSAGTNRLAMGGTKTDSGKGTSGVSSATSTGGSTSAIGPTGTDSGKGTSGTSAITSSGATTTAVGTTKIITDKGKGGSDSAKGTGTVDSSKGTVASDSVRGTLEIDARVGQAQVDNARGSARVSTTRPEIDVKKFADKTHVLPGDTVTFTITVTNSGTMDVEKIDVFDELPSEVEPISVSGGEMRANKKVATARFPGPLHPGESATFTVITRTK